ncbi:MAG: AarF/UbiB family protein [Anaerolineales bacterium]|jgi:predicted unusual protein kinase regulating ubiquinone biosynthesis (AarF/ABC1/UbiB family)
MSRLRYLRIVFFFGRVVLGLIFWEIILRYIGLRRLADRTRTRRLQKIARGYRNMAVRMGGVLIKVGQFLSARADILPMEITDELSGLQDEVPPEDFEGIKQLAEAELGGKLSDKFAEFEEEPLAAASLGQVHRARLAGMIDGKVNRYVDVVVKIQRPDIETIIATDVAALRTVGKWLMRYPPIRKRADVPALLAEFTRILYEEIDYLAEGSNADTFAENFKDIPGVCIPGVIWSHTTRRVLTLEDVYAIKVTDYGEIAASGVERSAVAKRLFDIYLRMIFEDDFFHADPHPGNLFVDPGTVDEDGERQWLLTFVDFGMVGHVPPNARVGLRELIIALATRDSKRMANSYQMLNVLLPHADLELIAEAEQAAFDRFWGKNMDELSEIPFAEMHDFAIEFRELVYEMPFQVPHDLVFLVRTVAILAGICTGLDPEFNVWDGLIPYAKTMLAEDGGSRWDFILGEAGKIFQTIVTIPQRMASALEKIDRGKLNIRIPRLDPLIWRIDRGLRRVAYGLIFFALLTNAVQLHLGGEMEYAWVLYGGATITLAAFFFTRPHMGRRGD